MHSELIQSRIVKMAFSEGPDQTAPLKELSDLSLALLSGLVLVFGNSQTFAVAPYLSFILSPRDFSSFKMCFIYTGFTWNLFIINHFTL